MSFCNKRGGVKIPLKRAKTIFWDFFAFLTPTEGVDHFYSTLRTCLASVTIMESHLTSGIPHLQVKTGQKRPILTVLR